jgi:hypothetical protein
MTIGLGTYAFFWQWHDTADNPLTLPQMIDRTADLGVSCSRSAIILRSSPTSRLISTAFAATPPAAVCGWNSAPEASGPRICAVISI